MRFLSPARHRRAAWRLVLALACGATPAWAQVDPATAGPAAAPASPDTPAPAADEDDARPSGADTRRAARAARPPVTPRFEIELDAPEELHAFLLRHLDIQRFREQRSLDATELERLLSELPANARELIATRGYFAPRIEIGEPLPPTEAALAAAGQGPAPLGRIPVRVDPGPPTTVQSVQISFLGDIASDADAQAQREEIQREAALLAGQRFTQDQWDRTKTAALRRLTAQRYPGGRISSSLADVDGASASARLYVELDSGAHRRFGAIEIDGAQRYDREMSERIVRLTGLTPGSDYDLALLQQAQQRLLDSGYYDAAFVYVEPGAGGGALPVKVQLREAMRQKLVLGIGASTDNGARLSLEHIHNRLPGIGWRALSTLRFERQDSLAKTEWSSPLDKEGWRWVSLLQAAKQDTNQVETTSQRARFGQAQDGVEYDRSVYLQYDRARTLTDSERLSGIKGRIESSVTANYAWSRERFDDPISPNRGHALAVELGVGSTLGITRKPFGRTQARWLGYFPLDREAELPSTVPGERATARPPTRLGRLALRLEGGAVIAERSTPVPDTQLFYAGGDASVRGYGLRDIGVVQPDGSVLAGRYKAVVSLEWQRPIWGDGVSRSPFEHVLFVDGGAVANRVSELDFLWGVGTGLRYNSPVGPLQVDIAYGVQPRKLRLHLSVGFVF